MIRIIDAHDVVVGKVKYVEMWGLSTDTPPVELDDGVGIATGSLFIMIDTGDIGVYDEEFGAWIPFGNISHNITDIPNLPNDEEVPPSEGLPNTSPSET